MVARYERMNCCGSKLNRTIVLSELRYKARPWLQAHPLTKLVADKVCKVSRYVSGVRAELEAFCVLVPRSIGPALRIRSDVVLDPRELCLPPAERAAPGLNRPEVLRLR